MKKKRYWLFFFLRDYKMFKTYNKIDKIITNTYYNNNEKIIRLSNIKIGKSSVNIGINTASKIINSYDNRFVNNDTYSSKSLRLH